MFIKRGLQVWPQKGFPLRELPTLQAHRGYCHLGSAENTLEAFRSAYDYGFKMVELDVHLSKDEIPVVFHDFDLRHYQKKFGKTHLVDHRHISEVEASELADMGIPSLHEVLTQTQLSFYNIELKTEIFTHWQFEERVVDLVMSLNMSQRVMFSSFAPRSVHRLFNLTSEMPIAFLCEKWNALFSQLIPFHMINICDSGLDTSLMVDFNSKSIPVSVWTVNESERARNLLREGVRSIITDKIEPRHLLDSTTLG